MNTKSDPSEPWDTKPAGGTIPNYINLAAGLGKATRERAATAVRGLLSQAGLEDAADTAGERITKLADEVAAASRANRELMVKMVATEVEKVADQLGFARKEDLDDLRREVRDLRVGLAHQSIRTEEVAAETAPADNPPASPVAANKTAAKRTAAKKTATEKTATDKPAARKTAAKKSPAKKSPAKKTAAKKTAAKKTAAKKTAAEKQPAGAGATG